MTRGCGRRLIMLVVLLALGPLSAVPAATAATIHDPMPVLAYYYIWFTPGSWDRAKTDYPLLGRYSSDDEQIMREHIRLAKAAGIDGFIVSWKSTDALDRRLDMFVTVAAEEHFKLAIIYQALDFERRPQPIATIARDLDRFADRYAGNPVFDLFGKPVVVWSGTWEFAASDIDGVTSLRRDRLLILGSARSTSEYEQIASSVDGDAYYWSSVDPATFPGYPQKLADMSAAVHARRGLWIAPAAPGFDARLIGGTRNVERNNGATLRTEWNAAMASSPDAVGLISWNEFSENSHIEPSQRYGDEALRVVADLRGAQAPRLRTVDSSEPAGASKRIYPLIVIGATALGFIALLGFLLYRARGRTGSGGSRTRRWLIRTFDL